MFSKRGKGANVSRCFALCRESLLNQETSRGSDLMTSDKDQELESLRNEVHGHETLSTDVDHSDGFVLSSDLVA